MEAEAYWNTTCAKLSFLKTLKLSGAEQALTEASITDVNARSENPTCPTLPRYVVALREPVMRTLLHGFLLSLKHLGYVGFSDYGLGLGHFADSEGFWSEIRAFLSACSANLVETIGYPSRPVMHHPLGTALTH